MHDIRLWLLESATRWAELRERSALTGGSEEQQELASLAPLQYRWLSDQLRARRPDLFPGDTTPLSAFTTKPDLRYYRKNLEAGDYVRIEIVLPADQIVLFDHCDWWDAVMNGHHLGDSEQEWREAEAWEEECDSLGLRAAPDKLPVPLHDRLLATWTRMFDTEHTPPQCLWAFVGQVTLENIVRTTPFMAM